jgi:anti-anti-sigma factor
MVRATNDERVTMRPDEGDLDAVTASAPLTLELHRGADDDVRIEVVGYVDHSTCDNLRGLAHSVLASGATSITLDCTRMSFMDSSGLGIVAEMATYTSSRGGSLTLLRPTPIIMRLLSVTGLDSLVQVHT